MEEVPGYSNKHTNQIVMKSIYVFFLLLLSAGVQAQWTQKANFPGGARTKAATFTIGDKIYLVGGIDNSGATRKDVWQYNMSTNTWSHKNDFPGQERYGAVAFVINGFGFISTGGNDFGFLDDIWEYDETNDNWIQRPGLPSLSPQHENQRREAFAFVIGGKVYLGGGDGWVFGANQTWNYAFFDLWEFDPTNNNWIQKASIPDNLGRDFAIAATINGKGYVGLGNDVDQTINRQSFWEYDPATDVWTQKADFPATFTTDAASFVMDSTLYVTGGVDLTPVSLSNQVYRYDPSTDSWSSLTAFSGGAIAGHCAGSNGSRAFVLTGYRSNLALRNDVWEYTPSTTSTNDLADASAVQVFPNPATTSLHIKMKNNSSEMYFDLYDALGNKVVNQRLTNSESQIDIAKLPSGIYHYTLYSRGNDQSNGRIVKE